MSASRAKAGAGEAGGTRVGPARRARGEQGSGRGRAPARDPAERWELPCPEARVHEAGRGVQEVFPITPRRAADVPAGALDALTEACGVEGLGQLFIIPEAVRATGVGREHVISPASVLGFGARAVGLWTAQPQPGVKAAIPVLAISAIQDVTILLYGRLSVVSRGIRLTVRYNTLARAGLKPVLLELRERLAGNPLPLPGGEGQEPPELPLKWRRLLGGQLLRLRQDAPLVIAFAVSPPERGEELERGQLLAVNPHELIYFCDPPEASHNYGGDSVVIPRPRITRVRARDSYLEVTSNGARLTLPMAAELRETACRWLG